ncbi:MAG TPA: imidazolonepropionase [Nitrososphaerales archaeon]|nr:imidazolonepropionase [Nitrososphaerales archaeon]
MKPDVALVNAGELVTMGGTRDQLGLIHDGAFIVKEGVISWVGTTKEFRRKIFSKPRVTIDAHGALVTPGFVDPHTHLLFAGSREDELERKIAGESYVSILRGGGGIRRTVRETRESATGTIVRESSVRIRELMRNGVTTAEVKTGYGQSLESELKLLRALERLAATEKVELVPTFLGLHARPREFEANADYLRYAVDVMLPAVSKLRVKPAFSDCFCEDGVFSAEECSKYLRASGELGFLLKIHADEFADSGGAALAAKLGCVSADHLGHSDTGGVAQMAGKGVVAVLLPGTSLFSGIRYADARAIRDAGCRIALGTDLSPNSWIESPQLVMGLACAGMKMTPSDALLGFTANAALAIGRHDIGRLVPGCKADFAVYRLPNHRFLPYRIGGSYVERVFKEGVEVYSSLGG